MKSGRPDIDLPWTKEYSEAIAAGQGPEGFDPKEFKYSGNVIIDSKKLPVDPAVAQDKRQTLDLPPQVYRNPTKRKAMKMEAEDDRPTDTNDSKTGNDNVGDRLRNRLNKRVSRTTGSSISRFCQSDSGGNLIPARGDRGGDGDTMIKLEDSGDNLILARGDRGGDGDTMIKLEEITSPTQTRTTL